MFNNINRLSLGVPRAFDWTEVATEAPDDADQSSQPKSNP
jgi:hypothetical protein